MTRSEAETVLAAAIDAESDVGIRWWPGDEMAPIALRRWDSFARRHRKKPPTRENRIKDLAQGLQAHFEPDGLHTHSREWLHLASVLADVLESYEPRTQ